MGLLGRTIGNPVVNFALTGPLIPGTNVMYRQTLLIPRLYFVGLAINRTRDHFGRLGVARELRDRTGLDLQCAAYAVADVRQMAKIGAGYRVGNRIMEILLPPRSHTG